MDQGEGVKRENLELRQMDWLQGEGGRLLPWELGGELIVLVMITRTVY